MLKKLMKFYIERQIKKHIQYNIKVSEIFKNKDDYIKWTSKNIVPFKLNDNVYNKSVIEKYNVDENLVESVIHHALIASNQYELINEEIDKELEIKEKRYEIEEYKRKIKLYNTAKKELAEINNCEFCIIHEDKN